MEHTLAYLVAGILDPISGPLRLFLIYLKDLAAGWPLPESVSPFAVALILIAVIVKLATFPLTATQMSSMRRMQELQPKLKELQERYKDDREKLTQATMDLYKEHGVNPLGGCLPLIVQMVVLFALYDAINGLRQTDMVGQPFLWIPDLSICEPNPFCAEAAGLTTLFGLQIPLLIILMVLSQFAYQKYATPPSPDPQTQAMNSAMRFMPIMFAFFFISLASGLVLYYTVFNVVSVVQQVLINRRSGLQNTSLPTPTARGIARDGAAHDVALPEEQIRDERSEPRRRRRKKSR